MKFIQDALKEHQKLSSKEGLDEGIPDTLIDLLHKVLAGADPHRGFSVLHASALTNDYTKFCPREVALLDITKKTPKAGFIAPATRVAFDQGSSLHDLFNNKWMREYVWGFWGCDHVDPYSGIFSSVPNQPMYPCGCVPRYAEAKVYDPEYNISGSIDSFVMLKGRGLVPVELKTIDKDAFKTLQGPLAEHRLRSQLYLYLMQKVGMTAYTEEMRVLYISKAFGAKDVAGSITPFKEFIVPYSESTPNQYLQLASQVKKWRENKIMPPPVCTVPFDPRVKRCACATECFSGKYPPGV